MVSNVSEVQIASVFRLGETSKVDICNHLHLYSVITLETTAWLNAWKFEVSWPSWCWLLSGRDFRNYNERWQNPGGNSNALLWQRFDGSDRQFILHKLTALHGAAALSTRVTCSELLRAYRRSLIMGSYSKRWVFFFSVSYSTDGERIQLICRRHAL
jgi:hypothetical protein